MKYIKKVLMRLITLIAFLLWVIFLPLVMLMFILGWVLSGYNILDFYIDLLDNIVTKLNKEGL
jgi:hypothetical protein